jgi:hypothetical protein
MAVGSVGVCFSGRGIDDHPIGATFNYRGNVDNCRFRGHNYLFYRVHDNDSPGHKPPL